MVLVSHCTVPTSLVTVLLSYLVVPLFFLTYDNTILRLCNTNVTCDYTFVTFGDSLLFFFLTFDGTILTLYNTNITCDCTFVTFGSSFIFFSHLVVPSSHCAIPTSHVTIFLSHSMVPLFFFSHLMVLSSHDAVSTLHVTDVNIKRTNGG